MQCGFPPGQSDRKSLNIFESFMLKLSLETINTSKEMGRRNREKDCLCIHALSSFFFLFCSQINNADVSKSDDRALSY